MSSQRRSSISGRSERLRLLESAFTNWRIPGYVGSVAYRARRLSPRAFEVLMDLRFVLKTRQGPLLRARLRDLNGPAEVFGHHEYEHPWLDWATFEYVLDIGAHVGAFTLWAASRSRCRILALEPNPATRLLLESNVKLQHLDDRVVVRPWAMAAGSGLRTLRQATDSAASALVFEAAVGDVQVEAVDLAGAIVASGFPRVDLVKLDIEGAEYEVFETATVTTLKTPARWVVECHPFEGKAVDSVERALESAGFEVVTVPKSFGQKLVIARSTARIPL